MKHTTAQTPNLVLLPMALPIVMTLHGAGTRAAPFQHLETMSTTSVLQVLLPLLLLHFPTSLTLVLRQATRIPGITAITYPVRETGMWLFLIQTAVAAL